MEGKGVRGRLGSAGKQGMNESIPHKKERKRKKKKTAWQKLCARGRGGRVSLLLPD
jgi:hypothetical protein